MIEQSVRSQDSLDLPHHLVVLIVMFEGLEAHHDIDRAVGKRDRRAASRSEGEVRSLVTGPCVCTTSGTMSTPTTDDGDLGQQIRAVALTAGDVQDTPAV